MNGDAASMAALFSLALVLGLRHGFDADHLAVIDGVARLNVRTRPRLARSCGALFSLGHGLVVVACVAFAAGLAGRWTAPAWLEWSGGAVSAAFLTVLGIVNVRAAWTAPAGEVVRPVGARSRLVGQIRRPAGVVAVGMLFALSFDTISQAAFFALAGVRIGGIAPAIGASLCFVVGMLATDGLNSLWVTRLVGAADRRAATASRIMATTVGLVSLAVASVAVGALLVPEIARWADASGAWLGALVVASALLAFLVALALTRRRGEPA